jgi:hypothetical protein
MRADHCLDDHQFETKSRVVMLRQGALVQCRFVVRR